MAETYSTHFQESDAARKYETGEYAAGTYADLLWHIERDQLRAIISDLRSVKPRIEALDFASGTGRITAFIADEVDAVTGIEISQAMCDIAAKKVKRAKIVCADIVAAEGPVEGKYDLITAFRFFLNADPLLQLGAMKALAARLRDGQSLLVFNNHGNLWSHKLLMWPYYRLKQMGKGRRTSGNYLTTAQLRPLLEAAGLRLNRVFPSGFYSAKAIRLAGYEKTLRWEERAAKSRLLGPLCVNQLYIASPK
jgi:SAM-dependent methyltransferase